MGTNSGPELDAWLRTGGEVVASSERAARAIAEAYHAARRAEGLEAWASPHIRSWTAFVRSAWDDLAQDTRLVLNNPQEESLWADIIAQSGHTAGWLPQPRFRLAASALEAHALLCNYTPHLLNGKARRHWTGDSAAFSDWLSRFDQHCSENALISPNRLPFELLDLLQRDATPRAPLLLAGFDRILPILKLLFDLWGTCRHLSADSPALALSFHSVASEDIELATCARWCSQALATNEPTSLLVIAQDVAVRRGAIERSFLQHSNTRVEFSMGVPLHGIALVRAARLLLRSLDEPTSEQELDWLFASGHATASATESAALQAHMRTLRQRGRNRTHWTWPSLLARTPLKPLQLARDRFDSAAQHLRSAQRQPQALLYWVDLAHRFLADLGWPGARPLTSNEFQARERWNSALDLCGSLGFDGQTVSWRDFLAALDRILADTLFAAESQSPNVIIAGPAESAGLTADRIWFLGADEDSWPARGSLHPLLPADVQRDARMPHASAQFDWDLAESITRRLASSASEVHFSYARQRQGVDTRPSRLIRKLAGEPTSLPLVWIPPLPSAPLTETFPDASVAPYAGPVNSEGLVEIAGGSTLLTYQSQCPFKAFAGVRLGAKQWQFAPTGLSPAQRGQLLHAVLHSIWGAQPDSIHSLDELKRIPDLAAFITAHVQRVFTGSLQAELLEFMPSRYLQLEQERLTRLLKEWLEYERARIPFRVLATERDAQVTIAGVRLKLRLDRVDELSDGSVLVIDYKSGDVSQKAWELPRPNDVQLPLYATFALEDHCIGGLVFAKVRPNETCFDGRVAKPTETLRHDLRGTSALIKNEFTSRQLDDWQQAIEQLARDFLAGRADVDPRDPPATCEFCKLYTICRVREQTNLEAADERADEAGHDDDND